RGRADPRLAAAGARPGSGVRGARGGRARPGAADPLRSGRGDRLASRPAGVRACRRHLARGGGADAVPAAAGRRRLCPADG
nr:hypothetical protein [Tanacetum cinerariifolium]